METLIKVDFYKESGKYYTTIMCQCDIDVSDKFTLNEKAKQMEGFIFDMFYTIEVKQGKLWSKWLFTPASVGTHTLKIK